eukprot:3410471-Alexandrium_andersonii.AAC.1
MPHSPHCSGGSKARAGARAANPAPLPPMAGLRLRAAPRAVGKARSKGGVGSAMSCLLYTSPSPRD